VRALLPGGQLVMRAILLAFTGSTIAAVAGLIVYLHHVQECLWSSSYADCVLHHVRINTDPELKRIYVTTVYMYFQACTVMLRYVCANDV
jgi:hypothetical protein